MELIDILSIGLGSGVISSVITIIATRKLYNLNKGKVFVEIQTMQSAEQRKAFEDRIKWITEFVQNVKDHNEILENYKDDPNYPRLKEKGISTLMDAQSLMAKELALQSKQSEKQAE